VTEEAVPPAEQRVIDRLTALLLTVPGWPRNYTATLDAAKWVAAEASRLGWTVIITDREGTK